MLVLLHRQSSRSVRLYEPEEGTTNNEECAEIRTQMAEFHAGEQQRTAASPDREIVRRNVEMREKRQQPTNQLNQLNSGEDKSAVELRAESGEC